jgi:hypothetical protein
VASSIDSSADRLDAEISAYRMESSYSAPPALITEVGVPVPAPPAPITSTPTSQSTSILKPKVVHGAHSL